MGVSLERFDQVVSETALKPDSADLDEGTMRVMEYMLCASTLGEIDFNSFTLRQAEQALDEINHFVCCETRVRRSTTGRIC